MKLLAYLRSVTNKFFRRDQVEDDTDEELRSHVHHRADDLERTGLDRTDAERRARIEFGGHLRFKEDSHKALGGNFIEVLIQDVRFSLRVLRKSPGFTLAAVLTLALGIGANAVVFSVLNAFILRPLNMPQEESLYGIERGESGFQSYPDYIDQRDRNRSFEDLAAFNMTQAALDTGNNPIPSWVYEASGNYFDVLGIRPCLGNFFHANDEHGPNSAPFVVLSYTYWQNHFQGDHGVVGRVVQVNKHPFTIVGVAPPDFKGTLLFFSPDFFVPMVNQEQLDGENMLNARGRLWVFEVIGHLKPGVTPEQAVGDLNSIGADLEKTYPQDEAHLNFALARPGLYGNFLGGPISAFVTGLMILTGLILLAACANLGSLFAARAADRSREVALRLALGASRSRILRQLFTEAIMISLVGGAAGLSGSVVLLRWLSVWQPIPRFPVHVAVNPDGNVYVVALVLTIASGFLFGAVPVRQILHTDIYEIVKSGSSARVGRRVTVRDVLLVAQIAICAVLVTSSLVAVRGLARSLHSNFGFEPQNALLVHPMLSMAGYSGDRASAMQRQIIDAMKTIPDVRSVALVSDPPLDMGGPTTIVFTDETTDLKQSNASANPFLYRVSPDYFQAAGTTLLSGREFSWHDDKDSPPVAVVNREFASRIFGTATNTVGKYFKRRDGTRTQVVGIVEDGKYFNVAETQKAAIFVPILQSPTTQTWLVVRSDRDPQELGPAIRTTLRNMDSGLPVFIETWNNELDGTMFGSRMATMSLGVMGIMGAMLAVTGVFGMAAYSVSKRMKELGIRSALGAQRKQVLQAALGRAFKLLAVGSVGGLVLGILATRVLAFIVYQASPRDPLVLSGAVLAMLLLGLLATWIPARRALSADPLKLLREE